VGAPDGGPGLPGVGWSSRHGDLRIPHFLGLHGLQVIPILYLLGGRRRRLSGLDSTRYAFLVSASYLALVGIVTWQALRGQSLVHPDGPTELALAIWCLATGIGLLIPHWRPNVYRSSAIGVH
jgi:hypothetical protein